MDYRTGLFNHQHAETRKALIRESENVRVAWLWSAENGRYDLLQRAVYSFWLLHELRFLLYEGDILFGQASQAVMTHQPADEAGQALQQIVRCDLQAHQGWFLFRTGRFNEARPLLEQAVVVLRQLNSPMALADALYHIGTHDPPSQRINRSRYGAGADQSHTITCYGRGASIRTLCHHARN